MDLRNSLLRIDENAMEARIGCEFLIVKVCKDGRVCIPDATESFNCKGAKDSAKSARVRLRNVRGFRKGPES